jgi:hypothetical protein
VDEHLKILESAISDVGCWTWWTTNLPEAFQVEFSGVQLWNPPNGEGKAPSGQIALRFRMPHGTSPVSKHRRVLTSRAR